MFFLPKYVAKSSVSLVIFLDVSLKIHSTESQNTPLSLSVVALIFHLGYGIAGNKTDLVAIVATGWITRCQIHYRRHLCSYL